MRWPPKPIEVVLDRCDAYFARRANRFVLSALIAVAAAGVLVSANSAAADKPTDNRLPVPTRQQLQAVKKRLNALFQQQYHPKAPNSVERFVTDMMNKSRPPLSHPVRRYVVLEMVADLGARYWMPLFAFEAVDRLSSGYRIDRAKVDTEVAKKIMRGIHVWSYLGPNKFSIVMNSLYGRLVQEIPLADAAGEYDYALQMAQIAVRCARLLRNTANIRTAEQQLQKQQILASLWTQAKLDIAALKLKPADPTLNLRVGLFTWLAEKKRHDGLKLLEASGVADAARVVKLAHNGPPDTAAWLHYFELLQKLAVQTKQPVYSQLITHKITKWFNNQAGGVMAAFYAALQTASFSDANHLLTMAITQARNLRDTALAAWAQKWQEQQRTMLALHRRYNAAMRQVQSNPDFHAGNAIIGEYLCLMKAQWKIGCDYLRKSGKGRLILAASSEQTARKEKATVTKAAAALQSAQQALQSAPTPKAGKTPDSGLALAVQTAKQALAKAKAAAAAAYVAAATNWWHAAAGLKPPLQHMAQARAVHWYRRGYKPLSQAPAKIIYRVKRFEANGE